MDRGAVRAVGERLSRRSQAKADARELLQTRINPWINADERGFSSGSLAAAKSDGEGPGRKFAPAPTWARVLERNAAFTRQRNSRFTSLPAEAAVPQPEHCR